MLRLLLLLKRHEVGSLVLAMTLLAAPARAENFLPSFTELKARYAESEGRLLDRHGELLQERRLVRHGRRLGWASLSEVSPALVWAIVSVEDQRFYSHGGVDYRALAGALWQDLRGGKRGASTITMQTVAFLDEELGAKRGQHRGLRDKVRQMQLAWELEEKWAKPEILEAYLNLVTFRGEYQGVKAAARGLFDKDPHGLDERESLLLAALLKSPGARVAVVGERLCALAPAADCGELKVYAATVLGAKGQVRRAAELAPHLAKRLLSGATEIKTTLDAGLQRILLQSINDQMQALKDQNVRDAAALVMENKTGHVLAYVGSSGEWSANAQVDMVRSPRQAGSTLKPFLYGLAFEKHYLEPGSWLLDEPFELPLERGSYRPENYDHGFRGPVRAGEALASSLNIPAVRLVDLVGVENFRDTLARFGFEQLESAEFYGPALALGSADVTLENLVGAYQALANHGESRPLSFTMGSGKVKRVISAQTANLLAAILSDRAARAGTFGWDSALATPYAAAVKTGTSKDMRDNWCVGFTSDYTVGVWVGNATGAPMWQVSGVEGAAPVWRAAMDYLRKQKKPGALPVFKADPQKFESPSFGKITYPESGTVIALDPDIPAGRQRVPLEADLRGSFLVDGIKVTDSWQPTRGSHRISLLGPTGTELDAVKVEVR